MKENNGINIDKISLAKELSLAISKEIQENKGTRSKTEFEVEIQDIMNIILTKK